MLLLCLVIITGTDICTGTNGKDLTCAGQNCVAIMSQVLVGLLHLHTVHSVNSYVYVNKECIVFFNRKNKDVQRYE